MSGFSAIASAAYPSVSDVGVILLLSIVAGVFALLCFVAIACNERVARRIAARASARPDDEPVS